MKYKIITFTLTVILLACCATTFFLAAQPAAAQLLEKWSWNGGVAASGIPGEAADGGWYSSSAISQDGVKVGVCFVTPLGYVGYIERTGGTEGSWSTPVWVDRDLFDDVRFRTYAYGKGAFSGLSTAIAFDAEGRPCICFQGKTLMVDAQGYAVTESSNNFRFNPPTIYFARYDGTKFVVERVTDACDVGQYLSMAISPDGTVGIAYAGNQNGAPYGLYYIEKPGATTGTWGEEIVVDGSHSIPSHAVSLAFYFNQPAIAYSDDTNLKYVLMDQHPSGLDNQPREIADMNNAGRDCSLTFNATNYRPCISYLASREDKKVLMAACKPGFGSTWTNVVVDDSSSFMFGTCIRKDLAGYLHICYYDETNGNVKHAWQGGPDWPDFAKATWKTEKVCHTKDDTTASKTNPSIVFDVNNIGYISYYGYNSKKIECMYASIPVMSTLKVTVSPAKTTVPPGGTVTIIGMLKFGALSGAQRGNVNNAQVALESRSVLPGQSYRQLDVKTVSSSGAFSFTTGGSGFKQFRAIFRGIGGYASEGDTLWWSLSQYGFTKIFLPSPNLP